MASGPGSAPGRACPVEYRYGARALRRAPDLEVDALWVAGGLYGNPFALQALVERHAAERGATALVFNGDFHWFDIEEGDFLRIEQGVGQYASTRGNVETELASPSEGAGCGCGYPEWVDEGTVERSNHILARLRETAARFPDVLVRLRALPMHLVARVGSERVAIVHGDADSLAGWAFSQEALALPGGLAAAERAFDEADVRVVASSHTCLPVAQGFPDGRVLANNGAAGMPNFHGERFGVATRIAVSPSGDALYSLRAGALHVEAIAVNYDERAWRAKFLEQWPAGSDAHRSYFERIANGPRYSRAQARREAVSLAA
ncbi:MAG: hypothetical protein JO035_17275 [Betaproteobacteria bacterium]|nr:hypothetical protein [Betaproteobacteria bacterium]